MRVRALLKGDVTAITAIVSHPMETGMRKDGGKVIPAHFIQVLTVDVDGKRVVTSHLNTAVSSNPVFNFKVKGAKVGDKAVVSWVDNLGEKGSGEAVVAAG
ncbi:MAG: thiosulfate oxidation carrier complex protein SoxZ [Rhodocyclaceae bacterium]|nr:thiosulfate oxidation carrier complex protein SoxZ [Rhodocyclaceae bacterium]